MQDNEIEKILVGETAVKNIRVPKILLDRLHAAMLKKRPDLARKSRGLTTESILHFSALGLLSWEASQITSKKISGHHGHQEPENNQSPLGGSHK